MCSDQSARHRFSKFSVSSSHLSDHDVLRDDGVDYGEQLKAAGVNVVLKEYPGMIHGFFSNSEKLPAGKALRLWLVEEINKLCR